MKKTLKLILFAVLSGVLVFGGFKLADSAVELFRDARSSDTEEKDYAEQGDNVEANGQTLSGTAEVPSPYSAVSYEDVSPIIDSAMPSVVSIDSTVAIEQYNIFGGSSKYLVSSSGSGFIVSQSPSQLFICTNEHVVKDASSLSVCFFDGQKADATVVGCDTSYDLAIVSVPLSKIGKDTLSKIKVSAIGNSDNVKVGDRDIAIGNSLGYGMAVTVGYISALEREINIDGTRTRPLIQTDAAINPGNSGGPLLDIFGQVIGINCAKYSGITVEGIGYAIPINNVVPTINELINSFSIEDGEAGCLKLEGKDVSEGYAKGFSMPRGVYVFGIETGSHTSESDLKVGDIITKVNGQEVLSIDYLNERVGHYRAGSTVVLTVMRPSKTRYVEHEINVVLDALE